MSGFFKKLIATGTVLTIGLGSVAFADSMSLPPPLACPPRCEPLCGPGPGPFCGPTSGWCDNLTLYGSWLYWKVNGDEFDYAVSKTRTTLSDTRIVDHQTIHNVKFDYDSGFRLGAGLEFPGLGWGFDVVWTHFDSHSSKSKEFTGNIGTTTDLLVSMPAVYNFGTELLTGQSAELSGRVNFRYNTVDFEFGKWCSCNCCVTFRPHVGLRLADIQESFHDRIAFNGEATETFAGTLAINGRFFEKNRFKGVGVRAGLDLDLCLCEGWSFIGRGAASIVWGRTHLSQHFKYSTAAAADFYDNETNDNHRNSRIITDLSFGIRYKTLACSCYPVCFELAWEHHYLFNQHRFWVDNSYFSPATGPNTPLDTISSWKKNGDVALQGLTLTIGVDF